MNSPFRASNIIGDVEETHSELLKDSEASISGILLVRRPSLSVACSLLVVNDASAFVHPGLQKKHELMSPFTKKR